VAPTGLGYRATMPPETLLRIRKARPIGIWNDDQISSAMAKSSSHSVREPGGRNSGSPERIDQHVSHTQTMRRSTRCSRWRWSSPIPIGHSSHVAVEEAGRGACRGGPPSGRVPAHAAIRRNPCGASVIRSGPP